MALLEIRDLHLAMRSFEGEAHVLNGIDLTVERGEIWGIVGETGCGKSLTGLSVSCLVPSPPARYIRGEIRFEGRDLLRAGEEEMRALRGRRIGMIFQEYNLVERLSVMQNVLSGRLGYTGLFASLRYRFPPEDIQAAFALLDRVGLDGYHNQRADALSGGQRQRVGIARALMQRPDLLLLDEPTASLDPKTSRQIMRLVRELVAERQTPAIINIHDVALARAHADRIIGMKDGLIVFDAEASALTDAALTRIYGEEDWSTPQDEDDEAPAPFATMAPVGALS